MQTQAIEILRELVHNEPNSVSLREYLGEAVNKLGGFQRGQGKFADSLVTEREAKQIFRSLLAADPNNSLAKANVAFAESGVADALVQSGQPAAAIEVLQEALATFQALSPETASNRYVRSGFASANYLMGNVYAALAASRRASRAQASAEWREARSWYQKSLAMWVVKEKRGELESDERSEQQQVLTQITRCDAELREAANAR
jgi:tetratricopeptide (TPR) repeat protein